MENIGHYGLKSALLIALLYLLCARPCNGQGLLLSARYIHAGAGVHLPQMPAVMPGATSFRSVSARTFVLKNGYSQPLLPAWDAEALPFFCRIEYRLDKKNRIPFRFRLGSVEYVDWLEGKNRCAAF